MRRTAIVAAAAFAAGLFAMTQAAWAEGGCLIPSSAQTAETPVSGQSVADGSTVTTGTVKDK